MNQLYPDGVIDRLGVPRDMVHLVLLNGVYLVSEVLLQVAAASAT